MFTIAFSCELILESCNHLDNIDCMQMTTKQSPVTFSIVRMRSLSGILKKNINFDHKTIVYLQNPIERNNINKQIKRIIYDKNTIQNRNQHENSASEPRQCHGDENDESS